MAQRLAVLLPCTLLSNQPIVLRAHVTSGHVLVDDVIGTPLRRLDNNFKS